MVHVAHVISGMVHVRGVIYSSGLSTCIINLKNVFFFFQMVGENTWQKVDNSGEFVSDFFIRKEKAQKGGEEERFFLLSSFSQLAVEAAGSAVAHWNAKFHCVSAPITLNSPNLNAVLHGSASPDNPMCKPCHKSCMSKCYPLPGSFKGRVKLLESVNSVEECAANIQDKIKNGRVAIFSLKSKECSYAEDDDPSRRELELPYSAPYDSTTNEKTYRHCYLNYGKHCDAVSKPEPKRKLQSKETKEDNSTAGQESVWEENKTSIIISSSAGGALLVLAGSVLVYKKTRPKESSEEDSEFDAYDVEWDGGDMEVENLDDAFGDEYLYPGGEQGGDQGGINGNV